MIIANLTGGLGNQMFEYAAGRALALQNSTNLKLHFTNALVSTKRVYSLDVFNVNAQIATDDEVKLFRYPTSRIGYAFKRVLQELKLYHNSHIYSEKAWYTYDSGLLKCHDNVYIEGFWQNPRYFNAVAPQIRKDFTLKSKPNIKNKNLINVMGKQNAVSIHIRRGDYVKKIRSGNYFPPLSVEYYRNAIIQIIKRVKNPTFYVFSDDIGWSIQNLNLKNAVFIDHNGNAPVEDLRLMSHCKHHIIANSAFSWWGSWLNPNEKKVIIGPNKWSSLPYKEGIIQRDWITLDPHFAKPQ